jgi:hypothetical protein
MLWLFVPGTPWVRAMAILFTPTGVRVLILAVILACAAALMAPAARGETLRVGSVSDGVANPSISDRATLGTPPASTGLILADEFTWDQFVRFWRQQMGSMTGVVGTVLLVAGIAFLIIMSKGKG